VTGNEHETGITMVHRNIKGNGMDIGGAVFALKAGNKVARKGWNGKDMWLMLATEGKFRNASRMVASNPGGDLEPFVVMKTADAKLVPWLCSQTDLLATDWEEVE